MAKWDGWNEPTSYSNWKQKAWTIHKSAKILTKIQVPHYRSDKTWIRSTCFAYSILQFFIGNVSIWNLFHAQHGSLNKFNMVRTKKNDVRRGIAPAQKVPRAVLLDKAAPSNPRPHRFCPGTCTRMEIRKWRFLQSWKLLIRRLWFSCLVCEIAEDYIEAPRSKPEASHTLHYAAESYLVRIFEDTNFIAEHAKRITIYLKGISLVRRIRGKIE